MKISDFQWLRPVIEAGDSFFYGSGRVTEEKTHVRDGVDIKRFMIAILFAVLPVALAAVYFFGLKAVFIILVSYIAGGIVEVFFCIIRKKKITEGLLILGILYPLTLPIAIPLWMVALGMIVGIILGKEAFGGRFNPALVGSSFLYLSFPLQMTGRVFQEPIHTFDIKILLWGNCGGSLGETSAILILLGGIFLIATRVVNWRTVAASLFAAALFGFLLYEGGSVKDRLFLSAFTVLSEGMLFNCMFMATYPGTGPLTQKGHYIYGFAIGAVAVVIRRYSGLEGVMFAILLMNMLASLIDEIVIRLYYQEESSE